MRILSIAIVAIIILGVGTSYAGGNGIHGLSMRYGGGINMGVGRPAYGYGYGYGGYNPYNRGYGYGYPNRGFGIGAGANVNGYLGWTNNRGFTGLTFGFGSNGSIGFNRGGYRNSWW